MRRTVTVFLGSRAGPVGLLHYDAVGVRESSAFEYDPAWLRSESAFALDPELPLVPGAQYHRKRGVGSAFHAAISDTEPDGWGRKVILRDHAKRRQNTRHKDKRVDANRLNALDFLLAANDFGRVGALRFRDEQGVFQRKMEKGHRTTPPLIELNLLLAATAAVERNVETATDLAYLRGHGTSLGGLRPKCSVLDEDGHLALAKFPSINDERSVTKGEILALTLAASAQINAATGRLIDSDGVPVALIRRFDRSSDGRRLMYISAATMLGVEHDEASEHTYTELVDLLRIHGADTDADIEELWRRIAFSILINNVDDHLRNHGFLYVERGKWRLAPCFDVNPFPDRIRELKTWISEDVGPEASIEALMNATSYFKIKPSRAKQILEQVNRSVASWRRVGRRLGMTKQELEQYADAFEHNERSVAKRIVGK